MGRRVVVFCEDAGHEHFARAAIERVAVEEEMAVSIEIGSSRGGVGSVQRELRAYVELAHNRSASPTSS